MEEKMLQEELLDAWLGLSSVISNHRLVSGFSFNEAFVLNLLYKRYVSGDYLGLTATQLCSKTGILKSQMNGILTALEKQNLIFRQRSQTDRRQIHVAINPEYLDQYFECHEQVLKKVEALIHKVGREDGEKAVKMLNHLSGCFREVLEEEQICQCES